MNATREEMKAEAVERMKMLNIMGKTREEFRRSNKLNVSEPSKMGNVIFGALYWLNDEEQAEVEEFEKEYGGLVYHVVRSYTNLGTMDSYLYVSKYKEEWAEDRQDIRDGIAMVYVRNRDIPEFSEIGSIYIRPAGGGVVREFERFGI